MTVKTVNTITDRDWSWVTSACQRAIRDSSTLACFCLRSRRFSTWLKLALDRYSSITLKEQKTYGLLSGTSIIPHLRNLRTILFQSQQRCFDEHPSMALLLMVGNHGFDDCCLLIQKLGDGPQFVDDISEFQ